MLKRLTCATTALRVGTKWQIKRKVQMLKWWLVCVGLGEGGGGDGGAC